MKYPNILLWAIVIPLNITAQNSPDLTKKDSSLARKLHNEGQFEVKIRSFAMATTNTDKLSDYYALAIGGGLRYESPVLFKTLSVEIGGMFIYNVASSDLGKPDSITQVKDRYEIGLFDLENPNNRSILDRLNEFNIRFHINKKSKITLGRQVINSPLINPQDGRMRPTLMSGLWLNSTSIKNTEIQGGWLWAAAPRSTVRWFSAGESIGIYASGVTVSGTPSKYSTNINSKGIFVGGIKNQTLKYTTLTAWNYFIENVSNSAFLQTDFEYPLSKMGLKMNIAAQIIHQNAINNGGNIDPTKTYMAAGEKSWILGGRFGITSKKHQFTLNYTRITKDGRFIFPREWGRDPLLTFLPRERNEGFGDVHAFNIVHTYKTPIIQTFLGLGYYKMPDVKDFRLNKYGLPSYSQLNASLKYNFQGFWKNLTLEILIAHKWGLGNIYANEKFRINKVDMTNYNWVLNYKF